MDSTLYQAAQSLPPEKQGALYHIATSPGTPATLAQRMYLSLTQVAALLLGSGLIFWFAANWQEQSRMFKLGLLEGALALCVLAACISSRARIPGLLAANLVLGGLLAFIGQTYQTGADAWQLFAVWAALSLLWTALARSDVLWTLWVLISAAALIMWQGSLNLNDWLDWWDWLDTSLPPSVFVRDMLLWALIALLPWLISLLPGLQLPQGLGIWSHRLAMGLALTAWTLYGIGINWGNPSGFSDAALLAMLLIAAVSCGSLFGPFQDFAVLCLSALAANAMVLRIFIWWQEHLNAFRHDIDSFLFALSLIGLLCLAGTVAGLTRAHRYLQNTNQP